MSLPISRQTFGEYCLRNLGAPVIQIEINDDQLDDRIDEALLFYGDYHFDASEKVYYKFLIDDQFMIDKIITLPENIIGVVNLFDVSASSASMDMFDVRYQIALNDLYTLTSVSLVPYYTAMMHIETIKQVLIGSAPIRFTRHRNICNVDIATSRLAVGQYLMLECYQVIDPDTYTNVWADRWLQKYATQLLKRQWGMNLKKYGNVQIISGTTFSAQAMYDEADAAIKAMEERVVHDFALPCSYELG